MTRPLRILVVEDELPIQREYAGEAEFAEQARVHLRELTAVDLRDNYDEWYDRRLFSEEVQLQILAKRDTAVQASRWHAALALLLAKAWPGFSEPQRADALVVLMDAVDTNHGDRGPLVECLKQLQQGAAGALQPALGATLAQLGG